MNIFNITRHLHYSGTKKLVFEKFVHFASRRSYEFLQIYQLDDNKPLARNEVALIFLDFSRFNFSDSSSTPCCPFDVYSFQSIQLLDQRHDSENYPIIIIYQHYKN